MVGGGHAYSDESDDDSFFFLFLLTFGWLVALLFSLLAPCGGMERGFGVVYLEVGWLKDGGEIRHPGE